MRSFTALASLKGRVALINGRGAVAAAVAEAYAELGAAVALLGPAGTGADELARDLTDAHGVLTTVVTADLADQATVSRAPQRVVDACGRLDILVNIISSEAELAAAVALTQAAAGALRSTGKACVLMIAAAYRDGDDGAASAAEALTIGGATQVTRWLAGALAPQVRVNGLVIGPLERTPSTGRRRAARVPLGRTAQEEDLKGLAVALGSDLGAYITGQVVRIDGGAAW